MTTHTPGPWFIGGVNMSPLDGVVGEVAILAKDDQSHTGVRCPAVALPFDNGSAHGQAIAMANARLIAAAPELLDALKALVERGTDSPEHRAAEAAIKSAEGA